MSTLKDVVKQLQENNEELSSMNANLAAMFRFDREKARLDKAAYLDQIAEKRKRSAAPAAGAGIVGAAASTGDKGLALLGLPSLATLLPAIGAIGATMAGLDDAFKSLRVIDLVKGILDGVKAFNGKTLSFIDSIKDTTRIFTTMIDDFSKVLTFGTGEITAKQPGFLAKIGTYFDDLLKPVTTAFDNFKLGFTRIGTKATGIVDDLLKMEDFTTLSAKMGAFFGTIAAPFKNIGKFLPTVNFDALKAAFGSMDEGTGLFGLIGKLFSALDPLLAPIKKVLGVLARGPFQIFLSVIDFVMGFFEGFTSPENKTLFDKITAGLEGGFKGVIKGFTDAMDLLFIKIPAFFAEKLGFKGVAEKLKSFSLTALVDPAWEAVKNFFKDAFANPEQFFSNIANTLKDIPIQFLKSLLSVALPPKDMFKFTLPEADLGPLGKIGGAQVNLNPIPDSLYKFVGIDGGNTEQAPIQSRGSLGEFGSLGGARAEDLASPVAATASSPIVVSDSSVKTTQQIQNSMGLIMDKSTPAKDLSAGGISRFAFSDAAP